jgi:hypothetical protein
MTSNPQPEPADKLPSRKGAFDGGKASAGGGSRTDREPDYDLPPQTDPARVVFSGNI